MKSGRGRFDGLLLPFPLLPLLLALFSLLPLTTADWHMWKVQTIHYGPEGGVFYFETWMALDRKTDCGPIGRAYIYPERQNVSGGKHGVRCKGSPGGCGIGQVS